MIVNTIKILHSELPAAVKLVAVSKFHPFEAIEEAYMAGQRIFAESRPQELQSKIVRLEQIRVERGEPDYMQDLEWHFIGHLQTNKLKMVLPYVDLVQSVDSVRLLDAIEGWCQVNDRTVSVLLEPHVAAEETKQGLDEEEVYSVLKSACDGSYPHICFKGIMGMATYTDNESVIRADFNKLQCIHEKCRADFPGICESFTELSIGMSDDYRLAIEYGSTMVRIGSMIFGERV